MTSPEFEKLLTEAFTTWDSESSPNPGLLKVEMTGSGFLRGLDEQKARGVIQLLKEHFPKDVALYWTSGQRLVMWPGTHGTGSDLFYVIFASSEWSSVAEGENMRSLYLDGSFLEKL